MKNSLFKKILALCMIGSLACSNLSTVNISAEDREEVDPDSPVALLSKTVDTKSEGNNTIKITTVTSINFKTYAQIVDVEEIRTDNNTNRSVEIKTNTVIDGYKHIIHSTTTNKDAYGKVEDVTHKFTYFEENTTVKMEGTIEKDSEGKVRKAEILVEPVATTSVYGNKEAIATFRLQYELIEEFCRNTTKEFPVAVNVKLPSTELNKLPKYNFVDTVTVALILPTRLKVNPYIKVVNLILEDSIIRTGMLYHTSINVKTSYEINEEISRWQFDPINMNNVREPSIKTISMSGYELFESDGTEVNKILTEQKSIAAELYGEILKSGFVNSINYDSSLGCKNSVKIYVGNRASVGDTFFQYYVNKNSRLFEMVPNNQLVVDEKGYITAKYERYGDYLLTKMQLPKECTTSLVDQIKNIPKEKTMKAKTNFTIKPVLPVTLRNTVLIGKENDGAVIDAVFTYSSSNKTVATVGKLTGKIYAKKKGTVVIKTSIKLGDGTSKVIKTKVTVE